MQKEVSILIPHYKTLKMTKLCLELIKKNTDLNDVDVIVIDNGSKDDSSEYLRTVDWIILITRETIEGEGGVSAHSNALDLAVANVDTPYVLSIHTDTFVISPKWLDYLLKQIERDENIAGVGSWKLEYSPFYQQILRKVERFFRVNIWYPIIGKRAKKSDGVGDNYYYLRSHCALYRTDKVRAHTQGFGDGDQVAGKVMHQKLVDAGFEMVFLESDELSKYIRHLNHATVILNPELHRNGVEKPRQIKRIRKELRDIEAKLGL
ncbi:MAG: glycosyltransferase [Methylophaga sp.]|nr:MAG: glycosyltransferase [Methylophaga sp.]